MCKRIEQALFFYTNLLAYKAHNYAEVATTRYPVRKLRFVLLAK